ncbi:MAG: 3D domain-containing protein [Candidatus Woykebacteria bacterium]
MLPRLAGAVGETFSATKNISTLIFARTPTKLVGTSFLLAATLLTQVSINSGPEVVKIDPTLRNLSALNTYFSPLKTELTKIEEKVLRGPNYIKSSPLGAVKGPDSPATLSPAINNSSKTLPKNFKFKNKLRVFATSYDPNCSGCNATTALGLKAGYGVIAVDPKVIPLGSKVYVPGYGKAIAGDTGGAIKGNIVDLGFDNIKTGWWSARYTDLYILK